MILEKRPIRIFNKTGYRDHTDPLFKSEEIENHRPPQAACCPRPVKSHRLPVSLTDFGNFSRLTAGRQRSRTFGNLTECCDQGILIFLRADQRSSLSGRSDVEENVKCHVSTITPQGISKPWSMLLSQCEASNFLILYQGILETWQAAKWTCSRDGSINICPPSQTNHRSWDIRLNKELIRTAFFTWQSLSMPTGHCTWKCLVLEIRPAEEVALTALPGHSDAQRYYKVTR